MAKKKKKSEAGITKDDLNKSFDYWIESLDSLKEQADKSYMTLLSSLFEYAKEVVEMYRKAYGVMYDKQQKEK